VSLQSIDTIYYMTSEDTSTSFHSLCSIHFDLNFPRKLPVQNKYYDLHIFQAYRISQLALWSAC